MTTTTEPTIGCNACTGRLLYRVQLEGFAAEADNFDQLVDHRPMVFTWPGYLQSTAQRRDGKVTVWRLADADQGGDWAEDTVIAYAGPHPAKPRERTWVLDLSGHGFFDELSQNT